MDFDDQAFAALQMARELLYELLEARASLRPRRFLLRFRYREANGQVMPHEQPHGLDQDGLIALELVEVARELIQPARNGSFAGIPAVGRKKRSQCSTDDPRLRVPLHCRE